MAKVTVAFVPLQTRRVFLPGYGVLPPSAEIKESVELYLHSVSGP